MKKLSRPSSRLNTIRRGLSPLQILGWSAIIALALAFIQPFQAKAEFSYEPPPTPMATPPDYSHVPQGALTGIPAATSLTGAATLTEQDIRQYVMGHRVLGDMGSGDQTITKVTLLPSQSVGMLLQNPTGFPDDTMLWYVEIRSDFIFAGSSQQTDGLPFPYAFEVFLASNGNLIEQGGLKNPTGDVTPTATPQPTATAVAATATPVPPKPTATPIPPKPTNTHPPKVCSLIASGTSQVNVDTRYFDADTGATSVPSTAASDLLYQPAASATFKAINGASIADLGAANPTCSQLFTAPYVPGGTVSATAGHYLVMRTNAGHYAKIFEQTITSDIDTLHWFVYTIS